MTMPVSPYALLCASKPKSAPSPMSAYDLRAQQQCMPAPSPQNTVPLPNTPPDEGMTVSPPRARTHYIAGIHSRHEQAFCKAFTTPSQRGDCAPSPDASSTTQPSDH